MAQVSCRLYYSNSGEYAEVIGASYNPDVPVAKPTLAAGGASTVENGDMVMCLSCHRAHGSPYPDMLRGDPTTMNAHSYGTDNTSGCFFCHRTKDT